MYTDITFNLLLLKYYIETTFTVVAKRDSCIECNNAVEVQKKQKRKCFMDSSEVAPVSKITLENVSSVFFHNTVATILKGYCSYVREKTFIGA